VRYLMAFGCAPGLSFQVYLKPLLTSSVTSMIQSMFGYRLW
jgi:hypothetical protein